MSQIRKGFIANNAIDGTKLKLLNNEAVRAANADGTEAELMKLDSSNVLQFLKLPQVSADPSAANDVARKSYVDTTVQSASSTLQSAIDTEKGRIDAILSAATADADSFAEIVNLINSVDTTNDNAFASYVLSNDAALAQEVSDRQAGDSDLQDAIDAEASARASAVSSEAPARQSADQDLQDSIDSEQSAREAAVSAEQSARTAADQALQAALDAEVADRQSAVSAEATARQAADNELDGKIATEKGRIDAILSAATADADSFKEIVDLINSVDTENDSAFASYVLSNDAALAQEVSARQAAVSAEQSARESADANLQSQIDALDSGSSAGLAQEISDRQAADAAEQSARQAADTTLQSNIDSEASARQMAISSEQSAREAADSALDTRVDALEAVSHQKAKFTLSAMDIANGYVELSHTVVSNSELVFVGALYLHDGDHYTTSAGTSGTRITWAGDVSSMGSNPLLEGDVVYVRYQTSSAGGMTPPPGPGPGPGPTTYSFPMVIGQTNNGDGTTTFNWSGATLPDWSATVYLVPEMGPGMYDDSSKISLGMAMSMSASIATPTSGTYVLRVYESTGVIAQVTSASFSI